MIDDEAPAPRDHNQPPGLLPLEQAVLDLRSMLLEQPQDGGKTFAERKAEFLRAASNAVVRDRETVGQAADVIKLAGRVWDRIKALRMERSQPYRDTADAIAREAVAFWVNVDDAMVALQSRIDAWTVEEDERIEKQAREQREFEEQMRAKSAPPAMQNEPDRYPAAAPQPARRRPIRGDYGAKVVAAEQTTYRVVDVRALPDHILNSPAVHEAIVGVVRRTAKDMGVPAGIEATTTTSNQIR